MSKIKKIQTPENVLMGKDKIEMKQSYVTKQNHYSFYIFLSNYLSYNL